jgi:FkbM family methyltransferase
MKYERFVNYFDFGLWKGTEILWMETIVFPALGINNYHIYGFEACKAYADRLKTVYANHDKISIINKAITDESRKVKLYYAENKVGHSIFSTKRNVSKNFEEVDGIIFSNWLKKNVPDYQNNFNILKVNIEGAEWHLFNDLINNDIDQYIDIYCGQGHDVEKVEELRDKVQDYYKLLKDNKINLYRFTEYLPYKNDDMLSIIKEKLLKRI